MRNKKHNWKYPPGQHPAQQGEAYVTALHQLVEAHDEEDQVHFHYSDEIDRICGAFDDMKAVELRQVLEGTHDALLELLNSLIVEPAREPQSVRADIPPPPPVDEGASGSETVETSSSEDLDIPDFEGPAPYVSRGRAYTRCMLNSYADALDHQGRDAAQLAITADKLLGPLGDNDDPEELRDFIAGVACEAEDKLEEFLEALTTTNGAALPDHPAPVIRQLRAPQQPTISWRD